MAKGVKGSSPKKEEKGTRTSYILNPSIQRKIRYIALVEDRDITSVVHEALVERIQRFERKNGEIRI
jgi:hypothetical protein